MTSKPPPSSAVAVPAASAAPATTPAARPRVHYAGLDGLRALAVIAVMVYHLYPGVLPGGFVGVDIFFVISGFLITSLLVTERGATGRIDLVSFWKRRVRRLVPAVLVLVLVCCTVAWAIGGDILVGIGRQVLGAVTFSNNWLDIAAGSDYFNRDAPELFRNLWSLAVEEQFYLFWPLLLSGLLLIRSVRARLGVTLTAAAVSAMLMGLLYVPSADATRVYFGTDTHAFGLLVGAALAFAVPRIEGSDSPLIRRMRARPLQFVGLGALVAVFVGTWWLHDASALTYRGGLAALSVLTAVVILAAVVAGSRLGRALDVAPLRAIGVRSYGLYLWHWPVLLLVDAMFGRDAAGSWRTVLVGTLALVITVAAAWTSYRWVEQPARRHGLRGSVVRVARRVRASRSFRPIFATALALAAVTVAGTSVAIATGPSTTAAQSLVERGEQAIRSAQAGSTAPSTGASTPPVSATPSSTPEEPEQPESAPLPDGDEITAIGDSVMLAAAPELQSAFSGIHIDAKVSRSMYAAPGILRSLKSAGELRRVVVIGLGTNGTVATETLEQIEEIVGRDRELVLVNAQAPRSWIPGVNTTLATFADDHWRSVALADWEGAIAGHFDLLAADDIHPGSAGGRIYVSAVEDALRRLADVPPIKHLDVHGPGPSPM